METVHFLPELIVRTVCKLSNTVALRNDDSTSPENTLRNRASKLVPVLLTRPSREAVKLAMRLKRKIGLYPTSLLAQRVSSAEGLCAS